MEETILCPNCGSGKKTINLGIIDGASNYSRELHCCRACGDFFEVDFDSEGKIISMKKWST